jgi:hypothetical protein
MEIFTTIFILIRLAAVIVLICCLRSLNKSLQRNLDDYKKLNQKFIIKQKPL